MNINETILEEELVFEGNFLKINNVKVKLPDGKIATRDVIKHPGAAAIIPFIDDENVVLVRQFRTAMNRVLIEIPAGKLESGEDPKVCAMRELEEETGYIPGNLEYLGRICTVPGFCDEIIHIYKATNLIKGNKGGDEDEFTELEIMSLEEMKLKVKSGEIIDTKTISSLAFL